MKLEGIIKVGFIDCPVIYKEGLRIVLKRSTRIKIVGEATVSRELLQFIWQKKPHILLIDLATINSGKLKVLSGIIQNHTEIKVVVLATSATDTFVAELLKAGVHGLIEKDGNDNIINAIKQVHSGKEYYSKAILARIESALSSRKTYSEKESSPAFTKTEKAVIGCICNEMTNKEIADKLFLSTRTIEGHRLKILQKIKAKGVVGLVIHAIQKGLYDVLI